MNQDLRAISVIIPARNEEYFLPLCLIALREAAKRVPQVQLEIIVVINRCTDSTEQIAHSEGCRVVHDDSKNLSKIRNAGAAQATGEVVITLDADSIVSANMLREVVRMLENPRCIGGGVMMLPDRWSLGIVLTLIPLLIVALRYRISGGMFFMRKEDFLELGGFDEELTSAEDVDFAKRLRALGKKTGRKFTTIFRAYLITSCRKFDIFGDWFALKNPLMVYRLFRGRDPESANKIWYDIKREPPDRSD